MTIENKIKLAFSFMFMHKPPHCFHISALHGFLFKKPFYPQPISAVGVFFSPMVSGWAGGWAAGKSLSGLYLRNRKV